jgi:tetratricopeptide (TPR) repeat protein
MVRSRLPIALLVAGLVWTGPVRADVQQAASSSISADDPTSAEIGQWIAQLGSDRYVDRQRAQQELIRIGIRAFDLIQAAGSHADPEISSAAQYLVGQLEIPWATTDDSPEIRQFMHRFHEFSTENRLRRVEALANVSNSDAINALCRVVRYDASEYVSRTAAVAVLRPRNPRPTVDADVLQRELGDSPRRGAAWVRLYARQQQDPAATVEQWSEQLDTEVEQFRADGGLSDGGDAAASGDPLIAQGFGNPDVLTFDEEEQPEVTSRGIVVNLAWHLLNLQKEQDRADGAMTALARIVEFDPGQFEDVSLEMIDWLRDSQAWDNLDTFLASYQRQIATTRRPQYAAAIARREQGNTDDAERLAQQALEVTVEDPRMRISDARFFLQERHEWEWAEREYRGTFETDLIESQWSLYARVSLADMLHDIEQHDRAAAELELIETKLDENAESRSAYNETRDAVGLLPPKSLSAQRQYYLACHHHQQQDWDRERVHLQTAVELDAENPDYLIAMYRVPESDQAWRDDVLRRIEKLSRDLEARINTEPDSHDALNQWAWLVSNTEGDFEQAVRYSHRSIELMPERLSPAGCLDTLGRCYYAAGDLENAVKYQRQAVELQPSMMVMQRQLALFEKEWAEDRDH